MALYQSGGISVFTIVFTVKIWQISWREKSGSEKERQKIRFFIVRYLYGRLAYWFARQILPYNSPKESVTIRTAAVASQNKPSRISWCRY